MEDFTIVIKIGYTLHIHTYMCTSEWSTGIVELLTVIMFSFVTLNTSSSKSSTSIVPVGSSYRYTYTIQEDYADHIYIHM